MSALLALVLGSHLSSTGLRQLARLFFFTICFHIQTIWRTILCLYLGYDLRLGLTCTSPSTFCRQRFQSLILRSRLTFNFALIRSVA